VVVVASLDGSEKGMALWLGNTSGFWWGDQILDRNTVVDEVLGQAIFKVVSFDDDLLIAEVGMEEDSIEALFIMPADGEDEEVTGFWVTNRVKLDGL